MKNTLLYLIMGLLLGLSSCKKNDIIKSENFDDSKLTIDGKQYSIIELKQLMADYRGVGRERLIYDGNDTTFSVINYNGLRFKIVDLLNKIK